MDLKRLDIVLRSKLHWIESDVREEEMEAVFNGLGIAKKSSNKFLLYGLLSSGLLLFLVSGLLFLEYSKRDTEQIVSKNGKQSNAPELPIPNTMSKSGTNSLPELKQKHNENLHASARDFSFNKTKTYGNRFTLSGRISKRIFPENPFDSKTEEAFTVTEEAGIALSPSGIPLLEVRTTEPVFDLYKVGFKPNVLHTKKSNKPNLIQVLKPELNLWFSPMLSFDKTGIEENHREKIHKDYAILNGNSEKSLFTLNAGLNIRFKILPFLQFGTGMAVFRTGNALKADYLINDVPVIDSATQTILAYLHRPDSLSKRITADARHISTYIEIPFIAIFNLYNGKTCGLGIEPAFTFQFYKGSKGASIDPLTLQLKNTSSMKTFNGNLQIGILFSYRLNDRISLITTPYFGTTLGNVSKLWYEDRKRSYSGVKFTLNYKLYNQTK